MKTFNLREVCFLTKDVADDGMPGWANLAGGRIATRTADPTDFGGGGIYACFWDGKLIYIGSFLGPALDPLGGHVGDRIYKHVLGFTLRARSLGFSKRPLRSIIANFDHPIANDLQSARRLNDRLEGGSIKATLNKVRFASLHWEDLRDASPEMLFERFSFAYRRIAATQTPLPAKPLLRRWIRQIEQSLIEQLQPVCNTEFRPKTDWHQSTPDEVSEIRDVVTDEAAVRRPADLAQAPAEFQRCLDSTVESVRLSASCGVPQTRKDERRIKAKLLSCQEFGRHIAQPPPETGAMASLLPADLVPKPNTSDGAGGILPTDPRWQEYYTDVGQLRARATSNRHRFAKGRTLLYRESNQKVICLAAVSRLVAAGVEANAIQRGPLLSSVTVDFDGDPDLRKSLLRKILDACLDELTDPFQQAPVSVR